MSIGGYISGSLLKTILDVAEDNGASRLDMLSVLASQDPGDNSSMSIPMEQVVSLFDLILRQTDKTNIGLKIGGNIRPGSLNALGYALMSCENLYDALQLQKRFGGAISNCAELKIDQNDQQLIKISFTISKLPRDVARPIHDMFLSMFWNYANWITHTEGRLSQVSFTHSAPSYINDYIEVFGVPPLFDQQDCQLAFDKKYLKDPLHQADENLNGLMREQTASLLQNSKANANLYAMVAYQIRQLMPQHKATLTQVSEKLNMSERTLSRKLKDQGYSFKSVLISVRESLALEYLGKQNLSVNEIADKLGYLDYSSFSHAFRSWTGYSPSDYRDTLHKETA